MALRDWANGLLSDMAHSAALLDRTHDSNSYSAALQQQQAKVANDELTPSGRMLKEMRDEGLSFFEFSMTRSRETRDHLQNGGLSDSTREEFIAAAAQSHARQAEIEAADSQSFDDFLEEWNQG